MNMELRRAMHKHLETIKPGAVFRCIFTDCEDFKVGGDYKAEAPSIIGEYTPGVPDINNGYSLNYHNNGYYGVEGNKMLAKFVMIKDHKGRYAKRERTMKMVGKQDFRRLRRYARQIIKNDEPGTFAYNVVNKVAKYAGM